MHCEKDTQSQEVSRAPPSEIYCLDVDVFVKPKPISMSTDLNDEMNNI